MAARDNSDSGLRTLEITYDELRNRRRCLRLVAEGVQDLLGSVPVREMRSSALSQEPKHQIIGVSKTVTANHTRTPVDLPEGSATGSAGVAANQLRRF